MQGGILHIGEVEHMKCKECNKHLPDGAPSEEVGNESYCGDCAFLIGIITEKEYLSRHCFWLDIPNIRAAVHNGKIYLDNKPFIWEREARDRNAPAYRVWRSQIFERDNYTCQRCGQKGGNLNAHHIKQYALYPDLRLDPVNGITLCEECHKAVHKKNRKKVKA